MLVVVVGLLVVAIVMYLRSCRIGKRDDARLLSLLDARLLEDSLAHLDEYLASKGWDRDTIPDDARVREEMDQLRSIYEDVASETCTTYTGPAAQACSLVGVWKMQLGTKDMVRDVLTARTTWSTERLDEVRRKDALWAWVYSRYYGSKRGNDLFLSDLYETILMQTIVNGLRQGNSAVFDALYELYRNENKRKYTLLLCDLDALSRAATGR